MGAHGFCKVNEAAAGRGRAGDLGALSASSAWLPYSAKLPSAREPPVSAHAPPARSGQRRVLRLNAAWLTSRDVPAGAAYGKR
jgi:hypothetical protein